MTTITINEQTLSDGSLVYNVRLPDDWLTAVSQDDAADLAEKVRTAIAAHTNETIETRWS